MFVRAKHRYDRTLYQVVESRRTERGPRQYVVRHLGTIQRDRADIAVVRFHFWETASSRLAGLPDVLRESLAAKVPPPSDDEIEEIRRQLREADENIRALCSAYKFSTGALL